LDSEFFSLIYLVQALENTEFTGSMALSVISSGLQRVIGDETLSPVKALALGPCKVIPHEFPKIRCQSIDIDPTQATDVLLDQLLADMALSTESGTFAYRAGHRWTEIFEPMPLGHHEGIPSRLRQQGVYLITGGLGGLGLLVAKFLAETVRAKLVLTGRSALPPSSEWQQWLASHGEDDATSQRIRSVHELEAMGAEVLLVQADVSDREAMQQVALQARQRFGTVHGVFHAAGLPGSTTMHLHTRTAALNVFAAKVAGTVILDTLFQGPDLDFLALFSSINVIVGFAGTTDYTAANFFLDRYATAHRAVGKNIVSINWDAWQGIGMAATAAAAPVRADGLIAMTLQNAIEPAEGIEALRRILEVSSPQVAVLKRSMPELMATSRSINALMDGPTDLPGAAPGTALSQHTRPELTQKFIEPRNERERFIATLWQELLGLDRVGIDDDFFELGGHSLIATGLLTRIQKECHVKLPLRTIFEAPTVRELAERLSALSWATQSVSVPADAGNREEFEI
jgi:NAD(P)-dependent dehydrogenase (short-subunit alcohol dehydrogenase family)/acyl carrier protein